MNIDYKLNQIPKPNEVLKLYNDANWFAYTKDLDTLMLSLEKSIYTMSAWDDETLVGLVRVLGDGVSIVYIQDVLVKSSHKRRGIGTQLVKEVLKAFEDVRQIVLITDENDESNDFYASLGLKKLTDYQGSLYVRFI